MEDYKKYFFERPLVIDNMSTQMRVLIATVLSLIVFIGYDYLFMPKPTPKVNDVNRTVSLQQKESVSTMESAPAAPAAMGVKEESKKDTSAPVGSGGTLSSVIATVDTANMKMEFDALGRISQVYLKDRQYRDEEGEELKLFNSPKIPKPLEIRFTDSALNELAFKTPYSVSTSSVTLNGEAKTLVFTQKLGDLTVEKIVKIYPDHHYEFTVNLSESKPFYISPGYRPDIRIDAYTVHGAMVEEADGTLTIIEDGDAKGTEAFRKARIAVAFDRYYATAFYDFDKGLDVVVNKDAEENPVLFVNGESGRSINGYIGPKEYKILNAIHPELTKVIEFGWFTFIAAPVFKILMWIHNYVPNWGWAIVVLTLLVRIVLYPLTYKGMVSMYKLKEIAPKIKEIQAKYKGDPQKMNAHMMELYKKHKANPLGGCLPMLLQIPVFFAIYRVLLNAIELKGAEWILWIDDLSVMDPYFVLPILMGASMWAHQMVTPSNFTDPMQEKIFKWLPVIFTFFFVTFPAGLVLYWLTNNIFSIAQQLLVNKMLEKNKKAE